MSVTIALCAFAAAAALAGLGRRAPRTALGPRRPTSWASPPAALAIALVGSPWVDGKALAIVSPVAALRRLPGLRVGVERAAAASWAPGSRRCSASGVVWSNALAYSEVNLAPRDQLAELEEIGEMLEGEGPGADDRVPAVRRPALPARGRGRGRFGASAPPRAAGRRARRSRRACGPTPTISGPTRSSRTRRSSCAARPSRAARRATSSSRWTGEFYEVWVRDERRDPALSGFRWERTLARRRAGLRRGPRAGADGPRRDAAWPRRPRSRSSSTGPGGEVDGEGGTYTVWLEGSVRGEATLVDRRGGGLETVRHLLNNEGLYAELGTADLAAGAHEISVEVGRQRPRARKRRRTSEAGALAIGPRTRNRSGAHRPCPRRTPRELCGQAWDWIEARP